MSYNPKPTRVWSRVQHPCTFTVDSSYNSVYSPLTGKTTSPFEADYYNKLLYKGNILQYKKNTSNLTKSQRYSQICKGMWTNRTKSYATQTQTYTNPNISNLKQVNFISVPSNGVTTYVPGPFNFNIPSPNGCINDTIKDGGSLLCNTVVNPCTDEVVETTTVLECYPTYCSDVPGAIIDLCWNPKLDTWYPRQNLTMNNSTDKWPEGYKGLVSAVSPGAPYLMIDVSGNTTTLNWKIIFNDCIPISSFNIYENGQIIANVPYPTTSYNVLLNCSINDFYVTSVSTTIESGPSNVVVSYKINKQFTTTGNISYNGNYTYVTFLTNGTISFACDRNIQFTLVGGGASGGSYSGFQAGTAAGGGGQILNTSEDIMVIGGNVLTINIGNGGSVPPPLSVGIIGGNTSITGLSYPFSTNNSLYGGGGGQPEVNYSYKGGGGIGNNITSAVGGVYFETSGTGFGSGGAAGSLTNINASGVISLVSLPSPGGNASNGEAGNGSNGFQGINGTYYGGGGGGGLLWNISYIGGLGGSGGGGSGANASGTSQLPVSGAANTGGGGGGGFYSTPSLSNLPAAGGSGIAIIRFLT
jgi:hypothetical protein